MLCLDFFFTCGVMISKRKVRHWFENDKSVPKIIHQKRIAGLIALPSSLVFMFFFSTHRKMPQVSSGLRSHHVTPPTVGLPVRSGAKPSKSTGSLSLESTSLGQMETKSSQHSAQSTKPPSSTASANLGPGRRRNPGKARQANASAAQKADKLLHSTEDKSPKYIREPPLHEKCQPHVPSSQGPLNGTFSHGKKPCPPLQRSPRSRGKPPGVQQQLVGYDHGGHAQKRKGTNESVPLGSKCQRLSSTSRSSLLTWKGENIEKVFGWGLERRPDS